MIHSDFNQYLKQHYSSSKFSAEIGETGGFLTFSNSSTGEDKQYFTLSLTSLLTVFENIRDNFSEFSSHTIYKEEEWRKLGARYYKDKTAKSLSRVQTKPLFSTISKILNWSNKLAEDPDQRLSLSKENINNTISSMKDLILEFTPRIDNTKNIDNFKRKSFNIYQFITALKSANISLPPTLPCRFVSALQTKPFVILTGLSGSGKTKLAEAFSLWATDGTSFTKTFNKHQKIEAARSTYIIEDFDRLGILINQSGSSSRTLLPFDLIKIWAEVIIANNYDMATPSQTIQSTVLKSGIEYSPTLNSFHSPLKALSFQYVESMRKQISSGQNNQYCMVSVGADWTNREPILGYPNALEPGKYVKPDCGALDLILSAEQDSERPYFLILDEMNMSHVERYFADFLSAMESTDRTISLHPEGEAWEGCDVPATVKLPKNLFVIGTVNIDETTYMFSPKVLDRANVIEFRVSETEMQSFFENPAPLNMEVLRGKGAAMGMDFAARANATVEPKSDLKETLMPFFRELHKAGAEFGYRTAYEISRFAVLYEEMTADLKDPDDDTRALLNRDAVVDAAVMQKLLPKVHGSRNKIEPILKLLAKLCMTDQEIEPFLETTASEDIRYPLSYEKLQRMHRRVMSDGFTSYAEA